MWCRGSLAVACAALLVAPGVAGAQAPEPEDFVERGYYLDLHGGLIPFEPAYESWFGERSREPHYVRAAAWGGLLLAFGTTWYWVRADLNEVDWDFPALGERLTFEAVRFDNNRFSTNNLLHSLAGAGYYGLSRVNGLSPVESFLYAFAASAFWEYAMEWREKVSINDSVFTPGAGVSLGELFFHIGEYLNSAPGGGGWPQRTAAATLGFPRFLHDALDDPPPPPPLPPDALGFSSAYWHRFHLAWEIDQVTNDLGDSAISQGPVVEAELVAVPGYLRPGDIELGFAHGNFTRGRLRTLFDENGFEEIDLVTETVLAGWFRQQIERDAGGDLHGHAGAVGFDVAYRYQTRWLLGRQDELSAVHVAGPAGDLRLLFGGPSLRLRGTAHVDFAGVRSLAYPAWSVDNGIAGLKSILTDRGYYYGFGFSAEVEVALEWDAVALGVRAFYGAYDSIEGLDREQEDVTRDVSMEDRVLDYRVALALGPPGGVLHARLGWEEIVRWSDMGAVRETRWDRRWTASLGLSF